MKKRRCGPSREPGSHRPAVGECRGLGTQDKQNALMSVRTVGRPWVPIQLGCAGTLQNYSSHAGWGPMFVQGHPIC